MSDPRRYSISILENFSDIPLQEIALIITKKIEKEISADDFTLEDVEDLELGTNFLTTEEPYTWQNVVKDLSPAFTDFPDTCFCLSISEGECGGQYRVLFFNGKAVTQYPEIRYEEFRPNDFEYQTSDKVSLESDYAKLAAILKGVAEKKRSVEGSINEARQLLDLPPVPRRESLGESMFGYPSDVEKNTTMIDPSKSHNNIEAANLASANDSETQSAVKKLLSDDGWESHPYGFDPKLRRNRNFADYIPEGQYFD